MHGNAIVNLLARSAESQVNTGPTNAAAAGGLIFRSSYGWRLFFRDVFVSLFRRRSTSFITVNGLLPPLYASVGRFRQESISIFGDRNRYDSIIGSGWYTSGVTYDVL